MMVQRKHRKRKPSWVILQEGLEKLEASGKARKYTWVVNGFKVPVYYFPEACLTQFIVDAADFIIFYENSMVLVAPVPKWLLHEIKKNKNKMYRSNMSYETDPFEFSKIPEENMLYKSLYSGLDGVVIEAYLYFNYTNARKMEQTFRIVETDGRHVLEYYIYIPVDDVGQVQYTSDNVPYTGFLIKASTELREDEVKILSTYPSLGKEANRLMRAKRSFIRNIVVRDIERYIDHLQSYRDEYDLDEQFDFVTRLYNRMKKYLSSGRRRKLPKRT